MNCEKCNKEHDGSFGSGRFCSKSCAFSRVFSVETLKLKSEKNKLWIKNNPIEHIKYCERQREHGLISHKNHSAKIRAIYDAKPWGELGKDAKRRRVLDEQKHHCNCCGLSEWRGQAIKLELEHKDGNHMNDVRENLEALCPNCHSLTDTWRGKNKDNRGNVSDEVLIEALKATETIRQALIFVGLSPRGGNYVRANRLKTLLYC